MKRNTRDEERFEEETVSSLGGAQGELRGSPGSPAHNNQAPPKQSRVIFPLWGGGSPPY